MQTTDQLLNEREKTHGSYKRTAFIIQRFKTVFREEVAERESLGQSPLTSTQKESIEMILHKVGRIIAGDPATDDHWDDIAGYAKLVNKFEPKLVVGQNLYTDPRPTPADDTEILTQSGWQFSAISANLSDEPREIEVHFRKPGSPVDFTKPPHQFSSLLAVASSNQSSSFGFYWRDAKAPSNNISEPVPDWTLLTPDMPYSQEEFPIKVHFHKTDGSVNFDEAPRVFRSLTQAVQDSANTSHGFYWRHYSAKDTVTG